MNVLIVSPWFRSLAHLYGRVLRDVGGHRVLVVASDRHFQAGYGFCEELTLPLGVSIRQTMFEARRIRRHIRQFRPQVALTEPFHHPVWLGLLPAGTTQLLMLHEPDTKRDRPDLDRKRQAVAALQRRQVTSLVCFSRYAAALNTPFHSRRTDVVPLISEMPDEWVPSVPPAQRGFVVVGRATRNKGLDVAVAAWSALPERIRAREPLRLLLSEGGGYDSAEFSDWERSGVVVQRGRFDFRAAAPVVARARCMPLPYRNATQSGAQAFAMQLGVTPLVSDVGGLAEYQPPDVPPITDLEPAAWTQRMLAEVCGASRRNEVQGHYLRLADKQSVALAWQRALIAVGSAR